MLEDCFEEASTDDVEFMQWITTDRANMETIVLPTEESVENFVGKLEDLKRHAVIATQQARYLEKRNANLQDGEFLVIGDFSENYTFVCQIAAQSFHWNNNSATLHTFVHYHKEGVNIQCGNLSSHLRLQHS